MHAQLSWLEQVATTVSRLQSTSLGRKLLWKTDHRLAYSAHWCWHCQEVPVVLDPELRQINVELWRWSRLRTFVVWRGTQTVKPGELWIGERNMCTWGFFGLASQPSQLLWFENINQCRGTHSAHYNLLVVSRLGTYLNKHRTYALTKKSSHAFKQYKHWLDYPKYIYAPLKWIGSFVIHTNWKNFFSERIFFKRTNVWSEQIYVFWFAISNHESTNTTYLFYRSMKTFNSMVSNCDKFTNCDFWEHHHLKYKCSV